MEKELITNTTIIKILDKYKILWSLGHVSALAGWDLETYIPQEGAQARAEALSKISSLSQSLFLEKEFVSLIKKADKENLNDFELGIIRLLKRSLDYYEKLPPEFIEEFVKTTSEATVIWKNAKEKNNFSLFENHLQKIFDLTRKKAEYLGYVDHPYDALLDEFEEGLTVKEAEEFFTTIKTPLVNLVKYIKKSPKYQQEHPLEKENYDIEKIKVFSQNLLKFLHDKNDLRIDVSSHPFSAHIGPGDHRITTRYLGRDFSRAYSSLIHEFGHALYDIQSNPQLDYSPISGGSSHVIHESQSRFWENFVAKSSEFIQLIYPDLMQISKSMHKYSVEEIHRYLNLAKPSTIRTEADEVTYHMHILIRFELEKGLMEGTIKVKDLPKIWNEKYKAYLGVEPENDSHGVLQDVHWSNGLIGYFPTYSIGTALSSMWKHSMEKEIGSIQKLLKNKEGIQKIQNWLKENIHKYGSTYTFNDLTKRVTNENFNSKYFMNYLEEKYKKLY